MALGCLKRYYTCYGEGRGGEGRGGEGRGERSVTHSPGEQCDVVVVCLQEGQQLIENHLNALLTAEIVDTVSGSLQLQSVNQEANAFIQ